MKVSELAVDERSNLEPRISRLIGIAMIIPVVTSLVGWAADLAPAAANKGWSSVLTHFADHRNPYPHGHWNYTGGYALLATPWLIALVLTERGWARRFWCVAVTATAVMLLSASSRGAVLGAIVGLAAALGIMFVSRKQTRRQASILVAIGVLAGGILFAINPRLRSLIAHPESALTPNEGDVQRLGMLEGGWLLAKRRPWIGHGPGMTPFVYPEVRAQLVGGVETSYQLHNGPLQVTVELGVLGLFCWLTFGAVLTVGAMRWLRASRKGPTGQRRIFALCSACGLAGYAGLFVTDYQLNVVAILGLLGLHSGVVIASPQISGQTLPLSQFSTRFPRWIGTALMIVGLGCTIELIPEWRARQLFWSAWAETSSDSDPAVIDRLRSVCRLSPKNTHYLNHLGFRLALDGEALRGRDGQSLQQEARMVLDHSLFLDPAQEPVHAALGWLWRDEDPRKAELHFRRALALLPDRDTLYFGLALSQLARGDADGADRSLALECLVSPSFIASPFWTQEPLRSMWPKVGRLLQTDYSFALRDPATPPWRKPQLMYAAAFARWWKGGALPSGAELSGADGSQRRFFEELVQGSVMTDEPDFLQRLHAAERNPKTAESIFRLAGNKSPSDAARSGALARLASGPTAFADLLRSAAPSGIGVISQRIVRGHFAIMHRVLDGPGYADFAPRVLDSFTVEFAGFLFPMRGEVPGPVLSELLNESSIPHDMPK